MENRVKLIDYDSEVLDVSYCIETSLRDAQMRAAIPRVKPRVVPGDLKDSSCALVCFGPSLEQTWQKIDHKVIFSCSGATEYLVKRGITPTYHVLVDPRAVQAKFVTPAHKEIEYLLASCVHPKVLDALEGHRVRLWHIFDGKPMEELPSTYPRGEWVLMGGSNVGLRAMVLAYFMGWRKIDIFGMDCSFRPDGKQHADAHPQEGIPNVEVEVEGHRYLSSRAMVTYCRQFFHEVDQLPNLEINLQGLGLLQHKVAQRTRDGWKRKPGEKLIGMMAPPLISDKALKRFRERNEEPEYGTNGYLYAQTVANLAKSIEAKTVLDYGCGKGTLARALTFPIWEYDPAVAGKEQDPKPADLTVCINVLEHVDLLENVLADLARCTKQVAYIVLYASKDARTKKSRDWWDAKLSSHFKVGKILEDGPVLHIVCGKL